MGVPASHPHAGSLPAGFFLPGRGRVRRGRPPVGPAPRPWMPLLPWTQTPRRARLLGPSVAECRRSRGRPVVDGRRIRTAIINLEPARAACHPWGPERRRRASDLTRRSQRLAARVRGSRPTNIGRGRRVATRRPSVSTPATVPVRDSRPLRGRGRSRPLSGLRSARTVIAAGRRRRVRRDHASAATLACPDVEAQPTRPLVRRRHRATSSHLRSQADARTCYVPRPL